MQFLAYLNIGIAVNLAIFVLTLVFAQRIKDFFNRVPSHMRAGLKTVETNLLNQVKDYETDLIAKISPVLKPVSSIFPLVPPAPPPAA